MDESGASSSYVDSPFEDEMVVVNFSVWEDIPSLREFTYNTVHSYFLKSRRKWFEKATDHHLVMWWLPEGTIPTLVEAKERLEHLQKHGPSSHAFTLSQPYTMNGQKV